MLSATGISKAISAKQAENDHSQIPSPTLMLRGIDHSMTRHTVAGYFNTVSYVKETRLFPERGFGFVEFNSIPDATEALRALQDSGMRMHGKTIKAQFAQHGNSHSRRPEEQLEQVLEAQSHAYIQAQGIDKPPEVDQSDNLLKGVNKSMWSSYMSLFEKSEPPKKTDRSNENLDRRELRNNARGFRDEDRGSRHKDQAQRRDDRGQRYDEQGPRSGDHNDRGPYGQYETAQPEQKTENDTTMKKDPSGFFKCTVTGMYYDCNTTYFFTHVDRVGDFFIYSHSDAQLVQVNQQGQRIPSGKRMEWPPKPGQPPPTIFTPANSAVPLDPLRSMSDPLAFKQDPLAAKQTKVVQQWQPPTVPSGPQNLGVMGIMDSIPVNAPGPVVMKKMKGKEEVKAMPDPGPVQTRPTPEPVIPAQPAVAIPIPGPDEFVCFLCMRKFPNKEMLEKHELYSDLHKKNLLAKQNGQPVQH